MSLPSNMASSVHSVTFKATTNGVSPSEFQGKAVPVREVIQNHDAFKSAFKQRDPAGVAIIQHSSSPPRGSLVACPSGLVSVALHAYNKHHNLVLRPDDVWQAVLNQFSLYVEANAEALRDRVVDFEGQKQLVVKTVGTLFSADFGDMAARMVDEQIVKSIKDEELVEWLLPAFSTTTANDRIAASVSVMSSMQKYFKYKFELSCGVPSVTLLGNEEDWIALRSKFDGLLKFELPGRTHVSEWHKWLAEIGDNLVQSAKGNANVAFWDRIACHHGGGSGPRYVSGWIAAFAVWSDEGEWQGHTRKPLGGACFARNKDGSRMTHYESSDYPIINTNDLPSGVVSVPVLVDDNGKKYDCTMLSGQFGMVADGCTLSPRTDWGIAAKLT